MKKTVFRVVLLAVFTLWSAVPAFAAAAQHGEHAQYSPEMQAVVDQLKAYTDEKNKAEKNLATFDELDFVVFTNQEWTRFHESHSQDVIVNWPDGHKTNGLDVHIADLKKLFVYAPDTQIKVHPVRIGSGDFTAVTGVMTGTFTEPMPIGDGKFIQPTGMKFAIPMCTVGHWKDGVMIEEWLYWDNQTYMKQIGL